MATSVALLAQWLFSGPGSGPENSIDHGIKSHKVPNFLSLVYACNFTQASFFNLIFLKNTHKSTSFTFGKSSNVALISFHVLLNSFIH